MTVKELIEKTGFPIINNGNNTDRTITKPFCCDLLSIAMSKASESSVWVTVMGNVNTIAVAALVDVSCIILAENINLDDLSKEKALQQGITVLQSSLPVFETALFVHNYINA